MEETERLGDIALINLEDIENAEPESYTIASGTALSVLSAMEQTNHKLDLILFVILMIFITELVKRWYRRMR